MIDDVVVDYDDCIVSFGLLVLVRSCSEQIHDSGVWSVESGVIHFRLPNNIIIVGTKHVCDNLLDASLGKMVSFLG